MGSSVLLQKNVFDCDVRIQKNYLVLYNFSDEQRRVRMYMEGIVYLMCNNEEHGFVDFMSVVDQRITRIKIYTKLCDEILSVIRRQMLDHIPSSMRTMHTRLHQLHDLMIR